MASSTKPKAKKASKSATLAVADYIEREEEVALEKMEVDKDLQKGQVRPVDEVRVKGLKEDYEANPPRMLEATTWEDPGVCCACCADHSSPPFTVFSPPVLLPSHCVIPVLYDGLYDG